jgi:hypothetical protein
LKIPVEKWFEMALIRMSPVLLIYGAKLKRICWLIKIVLSHDDVKFSKCPEI